MDSKARSTRVREGKDPAFAKELDLVTLRFIHAYCAEIGSSPSLRVIGLATDRRQKSVENRVNRLVADGYLTHLVAGRSVSGTLKLTVKALEAIGHAGTRAE